MDTERFRHELALLPRVDDIGDLPARLGKAARNSARLRGLVEERIRCDRLLDQAEEIEPPVGLKEAILEAARSDTLAIRPRRRVLRSPVAMALAALVIIAITIGILMRGDERGTEKVDPELLSRLDLLLDWELLEEHGEDLDLLACNDLADILSDFEEEEGVPR